MDLDTLDLDLSGTYGSDAGDYGRTSSKSRSRRVVLLAKIQHNRKLIAVFKRLPGKKAKERVKKLHAENVKLTALLKKSSLVKRSPARAQGARRPLRRASGRGFRPSAQRGGEASDDQVLAAEEQPVDDTSLESVDAVEDEETTDEMAGAYGSLTTEQLKARHRRENVALLVGGSALGPVGLAVAVATQKKRHEKQREQLASLRRHIEKKKERKHKASTQRIRVLMAQILAARTLSDVRKSRSAIRQSLEKERISVSDGARLLSKLRKKAKAIAKKSGHSSLTFAQRVRLVQILRLLRAGRVSTDQAKALAAQAAPAAKSEWTEHAAIAAEDPQVSASATAASPATATPTEAAAANITTDTTAASAGSGFTPSSSATVSAVYSATTPPAPASTDTAAVVAASSGGAAAAAAAPAATAAVSADAVTSVPEDAVEPDEASEDSDEAEETDEKPKSNLKTYGLVALAGLGVWYFFLRPSTTVVVK